MRNVLSPAALAAIVALSLSGRMAAQKYTDPDSPEVQAAAAKEVAAAPSNRKAFDFIAPDIAATLSTAPDHVKIGFINNADWWVDNLDGVRERWREFLLQ